MWPGDVTIPFDYELKFLWVPKYLHISNFTKEFPLIVKEISGKYVGIFRQQLKKLFALMKLKGGSERTDRMIVFWVVR